AYQRVGKWLRLRQELPVPGGQGRSHVEIGPGMIRRQHIQDADLHDPIRMIEAHAMAHARAAIVAREEEPLIPETVHHFEHVTGQYRSAVIDVIWTRVG